MLTCLQIQLKQKTKSCTAKRSHPICFSKVKIRRDVLSFLALKHTSVEIQNQSRCGFSKTVSTTDFVVVFKYTFKALSGLAPNYMKDVLISCVPGRPLGWWMQLCWLFLYQLVTKGYRTLTVRAPDHALSLLQSDRLHQQHPLNPLYFIRGCLWILKNKLLGFIALLLTFNIF